METVPETLQDLVARFVSFLPSILAALVVFVLALFAAGLFARALQRALARREVDPETSLLLGKITRWGTILFGTVIALEQVNFELTAFLASLGILGFTVGFALQDVSKNFIAGLLLLLQQPFDIGEAIEVESYAGTVQNISLRATEIQTFDGRNVLIPNGDVFVSPIVNFSRPARRRVSLDVGVGYDADLDAVRQTALEALNSVHGLLQDPAPQVAFHTFSSTTVDFTVYYWVDTAASDPIRALDEGIVALRTAFAEAGMELLHPVRTLVMQDEGDS